LATRLRDNTQTHAGAKTNRMKKGEKKNDNNYLVLERTLRTTLASLLPLALHQNAASAPSVHDENRKNKKVEIFVRNSGFSAILNEAWQIHFQG
jgi:hypothetical protein